MDGVSDNTGDEFERTLAALNLCSSDLTSTEDRTRLVSWFLIFFVREPPVGS